MDNIENKYPVLYYDITKADIEITFNLINPLLEYYKREKIPFIVVPNSVSLNYLHKPTILKQLYKTIEEVEEWD